MSRLESLGLALFSFCIGLATLSLALASWRLVILTGDLPIGPSRRGASWPSDIAPPFSGAYFVSVVAYSLLLAVGVAFLAFAVKECFGEPGKAWVKRHPHLISRAAIVAFCLGLLVPLAATFAWQR